MMVPSSLPEGDAGKFNRDVDRYHKSLVREPPAELDRGKTDFETFFNGFAPVYCAAVLYFMAFVIAAFSWLGWSVPLSRAAFWLVVLALAVHTIALVSRIYISGRPPVTNLYSSAVFIGWGCVVLGLILEIIYRIGIGVLIVNSSLLISSRLTPS